MSLINGGRAYWLANGLPTTTDVPNYAPTGLEVAEPDFSARAFQRDIADALGNPDLALVDVRSPAEYSGEVVAPPGMSETAQRAGHIPGAAQPPGPRRSTKTARSESADELRAHYAAKGVTADKDIVTYCRIGERSSHSWFVLHELLGYERSATTTARGPSGARSSARPSRTRPWRGSPSPRSRPWPPLPRRSQAAAPRGVHLPVEPLGPVTNGTRPLLLRRGGT